MFAVVVAFVVGVVLAPVVRPLLRPLLIELIKIGVVMSAEIRRLSAGVREDLEDLAAKAEHEKRAGDAPRPPASPGSD